METAARKGDTRALFQLASRLCPKQKRQFLQLRASGGEILSRTDQVRSLQAYYTDLHASAQPGSDALSSEPGHHQASYPFAALNLNLI